LQAEHFHIEIELELIANVSFKPKVLISGMAAFDPKRTLADRQVSNLTSEFATCRMICDAHFAEET